MSRDSGVDLAVRVDLSSWQIVSTFSGMVDDDVIARNLEVAVACTLDEEDITETSVADEVGETFNVDAGDGAFDKAEFASTLDDIASTLDEVEVAGTLDEDAVGSTVGDGEVERSLVGDEAVGAFKGDEVASTLYDEEVAARSDKH